MGLIITLKLTHRASERAMLGASMQNRLKNEEIRRRTQVNARRIARLPKEAVDTLIIEQTGGCWSRNVLE